MISAVIQERRIRSKPIVSVLVQNLVIVAIGISLIFAVGFLPMAAAHNAAHDTRHALVFPCH